MLPKSRGSLGAEIMKKTAVFLFALFALGFQSAHADIRKKLEQDAESYKAFLDLGKTSCMSDLFKQTGLYRQTRGESLFKRHFNTLSALQLPLADSYRDTDMKKTFAAYQKQNLNLLIKRYREREEYFNINRSPFLICSKLFEENAETEKLYRSFLYAPGHLLSLHPESFKRMEKAIGAWHGNPQPLQP